MTIELIAPNLYSYTQTEFDAFGWSPLSRSTINPAESYGLDYESARDATPRWYGISFGDGNDGVSHMFPDYYVRTAEPFKLAAAAMIASFKDEYKARAAEVMTIDGESDYTIAVTIYNPEDVEESKEEPEEEELSYCDANGAWSICEVFPIDDMPPVMLISDYTNETFGVEYDSFGKPAYCDLESAFSEEDLKLAE